MLEKARMPAVKKHHKPANDLRPLSSQRMSYVVLSHPRRNGRKIAAGLALALTGFVVVAAAAVNFHFTGALPLAQVTMQQAPIQAPPPVQESVLQAQSDAPAANQPYDIKINAPEPAPGEAAVLPAESMPAVTVEARPEPHQAPLEVSVGTEKASAAAPKGQRSDAMLQEASAQRLLAQGDIAQALRFQHRAVELAPSNMLFRLELAILYDRIDDQKDAAMLYRQVIQAYDAKDSSLPRSIGIGDVRRRADYLVPTDSK